MADIQRMLDTAHGLDVLDEFQRAVYDGIVNLSRDRGFRPTVRELAAETGRSPASVHEALVVIREHGLVDWVDRQPRTLRTTPLETARKGGL